MFFYLWSLLYCSPASTNLHDSFATEKEMVLTPLACLTRPKSCSHNTRELSDKSPSKKCVNSIHYTNAIHASSMATTCAMEQKNKLRGRAMRETTGCEETRRNVATFHFIQGAYLKPAPSGCYENK